LFKLVNRQNFKEPKKIPVLFFNAQFLNSYLNYLKPIDACQTKANKRKNTGIAGMTSTIGRNAVYGSGKADNKKLISMGMLTSLV
jgi:hypothetical protein